MFIRKPKLKLSLESEKLLNEENFVSGFVAILLKQVATFRIKKERSYKYFLPIPIFTSNTSI